MPYCISLYYEVYNEDNEDINIQQINKSFILSNNSSLFKSLNEYLFTSKFNEYTIYIHNSSAFDMIFLLKEFANYPNIKKINPIIKDGKFINLEIFYEIADKTYKISFRDSYLLLPASLSNLSKAFNTLTFQKGIFPYIFVNETNLNYDGLVPDYIYFDNQKVSLEEYLSYKQSFI